MKKSKLFSGTNLMIIGALGFVVLLIAIGIANKQPQSELSNRELAMICTTDMATEFHIHPNLSIIANGEPVLIPSGVGISAGCMNPLHVHEPDGTLHVEAPEKRDFTLADFFAVWGQPLSPTQVLDYQVDETHTIRVTVNGKEVDELENLVLEDKQKIVIYYEQL